MKQKKVIPTVLNSTKQGIETPLLSGVEASIWSTNMLTALVNGVTGGKWLYPNAYFAKLGLFTTHEARGRACQSR